MRRVNDERLGDHSQQISATTAMANEGVEMPEYGLLQSDFRHNQPLDSIEIYHAGLGHDVWKAVSSLR
jgi:hypothetical protein